MNEILSVNFDLQTVSARDLYDELSQEDGLKGTERFSKWFDRFSSYGFVENEDFTCVQKSTEVQNNGGVQIRELKDYEMSVEMAKQICMLQKTDKGKKVRKYLLDLERAWNTPEQIFARALKMADNTIASLKEEAAHMNHRIEEMMPKEIFADAVATSHTSILIGDLAKMIKQNGVDIGQKRLFTWLRENGYLIKRAGADWNSPTQRAMELGLFEVKETAVTHADGHVTISKTTKVTGKGQQYFINKFLGN